MHHNLFPSLKGVFLLSSAYLLNVFNADGRSVIQWVLAIVLTVYAIYDYHLKVVYKHRKEREHKELEREQKRKDHGGTE